MKLLFKILAATGILVLLAASLLTFGWQPQDFPAGSDSAVRLQPGPWTVANFDESFVDSSRPTSPNRDYEGDDKRTLVGDVWYPKEAEATSRPLLIFSHGFTSMRGNGAYLAKHLASYGFVVVAVDYPLTSMGAPGGPSVQDVINQPGDISFLIDTLLAYGEDTQHPLAGKLDARRIGVVGVSLGGLTSTLAGYHPDLRDPRIGAVLSIAGPTNFFLPNFFDQADIPFMMLAGDLDALVPYASNAAPVLTKVRGADLVTVHGGSHTGFSGGTALLRFMKNPDAMGCYFVMRSIESETSDDWAGRLGAAEQGIDYSAGNELCLVDPLPATANVLRQQMITRVAVTAFFEKALVDDAKRQSAATHYLEQAMAMELMDVSYERSSKLAAALMEAEERRERPQD